jgi:hypothetical protein
MRIVHGPVGVVIVAIFAMVTSCNEGPVGGCKTETITIGTEFHRGEQPDGSLELQIKSVLRADDETYRQAVDDLVAVLDTLEVVVYGGSELLHINGSCWPPYSIRIDLNMSGAQSEMIRARLLETPIASCSPSTETPEGYGTFFITLDGGAWVVWYAN